MMQENLGTNIPVHFERITSLNVLDVCQLSDTLSDEQRKVVADNAISIAEGSVSENAWMRAIYVDKTLVGFIMLHIGSDWADGIDCPGVFLWRFMIAKPHQGKGYAGAAIKFLIAQMRSLGIRELYTSYCLGEASPSAFYEKLGFKPTGDHYGDEPEVMLKIE